MVEMPQGVLEAERHANSAIWSTHGPAEQKVTRREMEKNTARK